MQKRGQGSIIGMILFISAILPVILLSLSPIIILIIISLIFYKRWKKERTDLRLALMLASVISTLLLVGLSIIPIFYTFKEIDDPLFFTPLLYIFVAIPKVILAFILIWSATILFISVKSRIRYKTFLTESIKKLHISLALILILIVVLGFIIFSYKDYTVNKAKSATTEQEIKLLLDDSFINFDETLIAIAENNHTSAETLKELSNHNEGSIRNAVARNPNTPLEILYKFHKAGKFKSSIAENPKTPADLLSKIYKEEYKGNDPSYVIYYLAQNPNTPKDILYELANKPIKEKNSFIIGLARNPNLPEDLIERLRHDSEQVRQAVEEVHGSNNSSINPD